MIAFGHTAVGTIVGVSVYHLMPADQPFVGLIVAGGAGIVSHYITDFIPHGHFSRIKNYKEEIGPIIIFDFLLSVGLFFGLSYWYSGLGLKTFDVLFGIGGAQLPDVFDGLIYSGRIRNRGFAKLENNFHQWLHWHGTGPNALLIGWRDLWQLTAVIVALFLLIKT